MNENTNLGSPAASQIDQLSERAAEQAEQAIAATKRAANGALDTLQDSVQRFREDTPGAISRAAAQADELTRRGIERARQASAELRQQVERTGERTVSYIQDQPVRSVLIAAAAGAAMAALIGLLARSHTDRR